MSRPHEAERGSGAGPATTDPAVALHAGQLLQRVPGGIGRYVAELLPALSDLGVPVTVFGAGPRPGAVDGDYVDLGFPRGRIRYDLWHHLRRPGLRVPGDLVHATSLAVPPTGDRPLVVTVHDLAFLRHPQYFTVRGIRFHERGLALARRDAAAVIAPSRFAADELHQEGFEAERVFVAPHGIRSVAAPEPDETAERVRRLGIEGRFVLFVGTLEPRKGIDTLVAAWRHLRVAVPDLTLALAGPRGWGKLPDLELAGVVRLGAVSEADLDALYRSALALAYPSHYEGFGLPVLEAMVRGCPVVTTRATSLPEVVGDAGRLVAPRDPDSLAGVLTELAGDDDERARLAVAGRERAETFTWRSSGEIHRDVYRSVTGSGPPGSGGP